HFHYIMVGGMVMAYMGGIHFWFPKIFGKMYPDILGRLMALLTFLGFNLTFFPQFLLGYLGMPRRYHVYPDQFHTLNVLSSAGATLLAVGYAAPLFYLAWAFFFGKDAPPNPYQATGLEWQTPSPPVKHNFSRPPIVTEEAYAYDSLDSTEQLSLRADPSKPKEAP